MSVSPLVTANASKIQIDGKDVRGVQSIDFKVTRSKEDILSIDIDERIGAYYGATKVTGSLKINSTNKELDEKMYIAIPKVATFQLLITLFPQGKDSQIKKITFDECILEGKSLALSANGIATTTYEFSATRVREE
jgi:hypothetical protein